MLMILPTTSFASTELKCIADDLSPYSLTVENDNGVLSTHVIVGRQPTKVLETTGTITDSSLDLKIGSEQNSVVANGGGGIFGVIDVLISEMSSETIRMACWRPDNY